MLTSTDQQRILIHINLDTTDGVLSLTSISEVFGFMLTTISDMWIYSLYCSEVCAFLLTSISVRYVHYH